MDKSVLIALIAAAASIAGAAATIAVGIFARRSQAEIKRIELDLKHRFEVMENRAQLASALEMFRMTIEPLQHLARSRSEYTHEIFMATLGERHDAFLRSFVPVEATWSKARPWARGGDQGSLAAMMGAIRRPCIELELSTKSLLAGDIDRDDWADKTHQDLHDLISHVQQMVDNVGEALRLEERSKGLVR